MGVRHPAPSLPVIANLLMTILDRVELGSGFRSSQTDVPAPARAPCTTGCAAGAPCESSYPCTGARTLLSDLSDHVAASRLEDAPRWMPSVGECQPPRRRRSQGRSTRGAGAPSQGGVGRTTSRVRPKGARDPPRASPGENRLLGRSRCARHPRDAPDGTSMLPRAQRLRVVCGLCPGDCMARSCGVCIGDLVQLPVRIRERGPPGALAARRHQKLVRWPQLVALEVLHYLRRLRPAVGRRALHQSRVCSTRRPRLQGKHPST